MSATSTHTAASATLTKQLQEFERQYLAIKREAEELCDGLTDEQFNWRESAGRWSIAECLDHLNVSSKQMLPMIENALHEARAKELFGDRPSRNGFLGNFLIRHLEPPVKLKTKAPKLLVPSPDKSRAVVLSEFTAYQDRMIQLIREANGVDLSKVRITSLITKLLKLNLGAWFGFIAAHERRHVWQAQQVMAAREFPKAQAAHV